MINNKTMDYRPLTDSLLFTTRLYAEK